MKTFIFTKEGEEVKIVAANLESAKMKLAVLKGSSLGWILQEPAIEFGEFIMDKPFVI